MIVWLVFSDSIMFTIRGILKHFGGDVWESPGKVWMLTGVSVRLTLSASLGAIIRVLLLYRRYYISVHLGVGQ